MTSTSSSIRTAAPFAEDASASRLRNILTTIGIVILAAAAPMFIYPIFLMKALCFALFASAFNLLLGYGGLLSFGHAAFFGSAAYVCGYGAKAMGLPPELSILTGTLVAGLLGTVVGWLAIRSTGIYFAMITLALAQMIFFFCVQAKFTGGEDGLQSIPRGTLFGLIDLRDTTNMYIFVVCLIFAGFLIIRRTVDSPFGQVLRAIRDNEPRAISLGYKTNRYKHLAFILSASLAGLAGATKAMVFQLASLTDVHWTMSGEVILMTLIGGLGTLFGPILGAFILIAMQNYLAHLGSWVMMIQGAIFIACVVLFREGIMGSINALMREDKTRSKGPLP